MATFVGQYTAYLLKITGVLPIGVCYGMLGDNLPPPSEVIALYKVSNFEAMRLYNANHKVLQTLKGSNIQLLLGVPNELLQSFASDANAANAWIQTNVVSYSADINFRYVAVGNEVIPGDLAQYVLPAMENIKNALALAGLQNTIKVSTAVAQVVLGSSFPPSAGAFSSDVQQTLGPITQFLASIEAPLLVNAYPYFAYASNPADVRLDYAMFTAKDAVVVDGPFNYTNLFDAIVDAFYYALERVGGEKVGIVVSETGWPSAGGTDTTVDNAQTYNSNLFKHAEQGTPKRPGSMETYIFAMFNENQKPPGVEQNWGLFYPDKKPVYPIISF
ncbi:hypothetical protein HPP92_013790 [Vanilla planifolia]|uniref:Glucan endo-1,3-beta-D-glucosidase n=1 Tax=Vanilla planifolia TaxID=51239 RepID=A0A835QXM7_VANPL|nr:hypothetical protein HPP92_013790 [Vanilla planifolia]